MNEHGYSRRRFLLAAAAVGSAALLGIGLVARRTFERERAMRVAALLADLRAAGVLGAAWVARNPDRARPSDLLNELLAELGTDARDAGPDELRRRVAESVRADYAHGRVEQVGGWVLSRTEVRLCALAALTAAAPPTAL